MGIVLRALQSVLFSLSLPWHHPRHHHQPVATISNGTLVGSWNPNYNQDFFLGIPYAQPPVGDLRYRHPKPINASWSHPKHVDSYGFWCHSAPLSLPGFSRDGFPHEEDEDCLTLNVVRPSGIDPSVKLPVLVYIFGGGLQEGGSADQRYNMSFVVQESVSMGLPTIGVSFNYRVSGFGFLSGCAINESGLSNLGLYDQRLALHWTQENIAAFGGDPSRVTIQGESSGALSVGYHLLAYGGRNDELFRAAIAQSGGPLISAALAPLDEQDAVYNSVLNATGCVAVDDSLGCLRRAPANLLKAAFQHRFFFPVMDGNMIADYSSKALEKGQFIKVPLLTGTNTNEGTGYIASGAFGAINTPDDFRGLISGFGPGKYLSNATLTSIVNEYLGNLSEGEVQKDLETVLVSPGPNYGKLYGQSTLYLADYLFNAPKRYGARMWALHNVPVYSYRFDIVPNGISPEILGVCHFQDVAFTFQNTLGVGYEIPPVASTDKHVEKKYRDASILMSRMWLNFVNTLSPNGHRSKFTVSIILVIDSNLLQTPRWTLFGPPTSRNSHPMLYLDATDPPWRMIPGGFVLLIVSLMPLGSIDSNQAQMLQLNLLEIRVERWAKCRFNFMVNQSRVDGYIRFADEVHT